MSELSDSEPKRAEEMFELASSGAEPPSQTRRAGLSESSLAQVRQAELREQTQPCPCPCQLGLHPRSWLDSARLVVQLG